MLDFLIYIFLMFVIYSMLGWAMEVVVTFPENKKFINRGFLLGPWCPIYGSGAIVMLICLEKYKGDFFALFVMATVLCSLLEYITSFVMEKVFKARWWDYSDKPFNLEGRICLQNAICFGTLGVLVVQYITPAIDNFLFGMDQYVKYVLAAFFFVAILADFLVSCKAMFKFKAVTFALKKDNTREITEKVKSELLKKSYLYRHLVEAFPNVRETLVLKKEEIEEKLLKAAEKRKRKLKVIEKFYEKKFNENKIIRKVRVNNEKIRARIEEDKLKLKERIEKIKYTKK